MRRTPVLGAMAALCMVLAVAGCGGDGGGTSKADIKKELSTQLQSGGNGFDKETADCFADLVIDEVGVDKLNDVDLSADEPPPELQDELAAAAARAAEECDVSGLGG